MKFVNGLVLLLHALVVRASAVAATLTVNMTAATSDMTYTAVAAGLAGNKISVTHVDPKANNAALSVSLVGTHDIVVSLATGATGLITSTAALVKAAVNAHTGAAALVLAEDEGAGTGIVNAAKTAWLAGGLPAETLPIGAYVRVNSITGVAGSEVANVTPVDFVGKMVDDWTPADKSGDVTLAALVTAATA